MIFEKQNFSVKKPKRITETGLRNLIKGYLMEAWSSFPNQYKIAEICANIVEELIKTGENKKTVNVSDMNTIIKEITVTLSDAYFYGRTTNISFKDNILYLEVGKAAITRFDKEKLTDIFTHELMHGNIFFQSKDVEIPDFYENIANVISDSRVDENKLYYNFAYAMYSCYYQETQALISQVYSNMKMIYKKRGLDIITKNQFVSIFKMTNPYMAFSGNLELCKTILILDDTLVKTEIIEPLSVFGFELITDDVFKLCEKIQKISADSLKKCAKNSMFFFNELIENKKIKI